MKTVTDAVEAAADAIGEMLIEVAEGKSEHSYEDIAMRALRIAATNLLGQGPSGARLEQVAVSIYRKLHDPNKAVWGTLTEHEKSFWFDIANAAISAADKQLLLEIQTTASD